MLMGALGCTQVVWVLTALIGGISERNTGKHYAFRFISHNDGVNIKPNHVLHRTIYTYFCSNDPRWHEQDYIQPPYHHSIYCRHRNDGPHLCEDIRLYPNGNLNASVCLLPSFLIYVSLKRLIIDGASIVMSMLSMLHREQQKCLWGWWTLLKTIFN